MNDTIYARKSGEEPEYILRRSSKNEGKKTKSWQKDYLNINVGFGVLTPILIGIFLGMAVDGKFQTKPNGVVFFLFLGFAVAIYQLFRYIKESQYGRN